MKAISFLPYVDNDRSPYLSEFLFESKLSLEEISFVDEIINGNNLLLVKISFVLLKSLMLIITSESPGKNLKSEIVSLSELVQEQINNEAKKNNLNFIIIILVLFVIFLL